jgi:hypothetical protein
LLVGGALSGAAMIALSPKIWSRIGAGLFGAGAWLARFSLPPAVLGAVLARGTGSGTRHLPRNADINVIAG